MLLNNGGSGLNLYPESVRHTSGNSGSGNGRHAIQVRGGNVTASGVWPKQPLPYVVTGSVTVRGTSTSVAVLTIEAGVEVRFMPGTGLTIGYSTYKGALAALGTEASPIVFPQILTPRLPGIGKPSVSTTPPMTNPPCWTAVVDPVVHVGAVCYHSAPTIRNSAVRFSAGHGISLYASTAYLEATRYRRRPGRSRRRQRLRAHQR
ncbi:MAG: hypothetical protein U5J82_15885 [Desulfobacterales bacterium]|nr:hypothetical protein [Desulfobacterales bacterium]